MVETSDDRNRNISGSSAYGFLRLPKTERILVPGLVWLLRNHQTSGRSQNKRGFTDGVAAMAGNQSDLGVWNLALGTINTL